MMTTDSHSCDNDDVSSKVSLIKGDDDNDDDQFDCDGDDDGGDDDDDDGDDDAQPASRRFN